MMKESMDATGAVEPDDTVIVACGRSAPEVVRNPQWQYAVCVLPAGHPGPHRLAQMPRLEPAEPVL